MATENKKKILLVDDEKHLLVSLRDYLVFENFSVSMARSGEEALKILENETPDLIILDISMPGIGGVGFLCRISDEKGIPKYPVLVLTARSSMREFFNTVEVDGFMEKPCEEADLLNKIKRILARRQGEPERKGASGGRILIADDDPVKAAKIAKAFSDDGFTVDTVQSGPATIEVAASLKPDAILIKEILPLLNGSAVASLIEVMPSLSMIPVVIYDNTKSGSSSAERRRSDLKCIRKIVYSDEPLILLNEMKEVLKNR